MKNKNIPIRALLSLGGSIAFLTAISFSGDVMAVNCTDDISPVASCDNLRISSPNLIITIPQGTYTGGDAVSVISPGLDFTINQGATLNGYVYALRNYGTAIKSIANFGNVIGDSNSGGDGILNDGSIDTITNDTIGSVSGTLFGIANNSIITTLNNYGSVSGYYYGIQNSGTITTLNNSGGISGNYSGIDNSGTINTLNNYGSIVGSSGIINSGTINTLNNLQGLTINGVLPTNYNIIINSASSYGQLAMTNGTGSMAFGISILSAGSNVVSQTPYISILQGITNTQLGISGTSLTASSSGYRFTLSQASDYSTYLNWDLLVDSYTAPYSGPNSVDTQASIHALAPKLRGAFSGQAIATNFANMNTYDCDLFNAKGVCVSVGGQQTYVDNPSSNMTSTVGVAGYRVSPKIRIGGFLNQNINNNTVSGVHISNANPLMGVFAVWNQKEDRLGYQVKIANAYQDKDVTTTRDVVGTSQAGTGSTTLNTQSYVGELSYAFLANQEKTLVRPYAALRYTHIKQDGYTETSVSSPLTYAALADRSTTALVGVKLNHKLAEKVNLTGSLGIEQDLHHQVDNLTATGIAGLTSENFNDSIKRTRPVASIGAYYMPVKNQRIAGELFYQQLPFQSTGSATAYVNYTIGF
jgi:hypothetical protein